MNDTVQRSVSLAGRRWREIAIVFFVLLLVLLTFPLESLIRAYYRGDWQKVRLEKTTSALAEAEVQFSTFQRSLRRTAVEMAQHPEVIAALEQGQTALPRLFALAENFSRGGAVGVEIYDRNLELLAWHGPSGPEQRRALQLALDGQMTSYVVRTAVSSQLFLTTPVRTPRGILGAVLVRQTVDVHYPFSNRYVSFEGLTASTERIVGLPVEFDFSSREAPLKDSLHVGKVLYGIDSTAVGAVWVVMPPQEASTEKIEATLHLIRSAFFCALILTLCAIGGGHIQRRWAGTWRLVMFSALLWISRYALLWMEFPSGVLSSGVFDPGVFASTFGNGLAKNLGEMTLTMVVFALNMLAVIQWWQEQGERREMWWSGLHPVVRLVISVAATILLFWVLRGVGAVVRSALFDSKLPFYEARIILPTFDLVLMYLNLIVIAMGMIVVGVGVTRLFIAQKDQGQRWFVVTSVLYILAAILFGPVQDESLMSTPYRLVVAVGFLIAAYVSRLMGIRQRPVSLLAGLLLLLMGSGTLLYPLLARYAAERDRSHVERFAQELLRPVDNWFRNVVEDGIRQMSAPGNAERLMSGNGEETRNLALTVWAQSVACREGYTSIFEILDTKGETLSKFAIGAQTSAAGAVLLDLPRATSTLFRVKTIGSGADAVSVYAGTTPIVTREGMTIAFGRVSIAAGHQTLFRGENPAFFRGTAQENLENFYRTIYTSEFRGGLLSTSTNPQMPFSYQVPDTVVASLRDPSIGGVWVDEQMPENEYESLYVRRSAGGDDVVALSMEQRGLVWILIGAEKLLFVYSFLLVILGGVFFVWRYVQGLPYRWTFRDRLLGALLLSAVVPLALLLGYGRYAARERVLEATSQRLEQQARDLADQLRDYIERGEITVDGAVGTGLAEQIAADAGTDFNLFLGNSLTLTSRPELYAAGLLDTRLTGSAFSAIFLQGRQFYLASEQIGELRYAVGYRPLIDRAGGVAGIVSVPTLYRQDEVDRENATRSAFLVGIYAVVFLGIVLLSLLLAHRIARPILRLTAVTRKVAQGDMNISADLPQAEGELGELVASFDTMTREIQKHREDLVRVERELAWKEMAKQVAHEIKNPLTPMKLSVQHLRQTFKDHASNFPEILDQVTRTLIEQIETLSRIASEFSHFGRMPNRTLSPCLVHEVLREAMRLFEQDRGAKMSMHLSRDPRSVMADREELRRTFINIFRNSMQAMNGRGAIDVTVEYGGPSVKVVIHDNGPGISPEAQRKLFQPNFSTKTDGMGLGLAIVKKTIDDLRGSISIASSEGQGTTVTIVLPITSSEQGL